MPYFLVLCKHRHTLFVMPSEDFPARLENFTKKGEGEFVSGWVAVPERRHKARVFRVSTGGEYYVFADKSAFSKTQI